MPVEEAIYTVRIAKSTGWSEDFIRHQLPLCRGWAYFHAASVFEGERCRWPGKRTTMGRFVDDVRDWVGQMLKTTRKQKANV